MTTPPIEFSSDLEAQKFGLLYGSDDLKCVGSRTTVRELFEESTRTLARDDTVKPSQKSSRASFLTWAIINVLATIGIVFTNKRIFDDPSFKSMQTSFAAFHFVCTGLTLYVISRPSLAFFVPNRCGFAEIFPLSVAMCLNVILSNLSLAYSSIIFYQVARILLTPLVAFINLVFYNATITRYAALSLIPTCLGVGIVSYYDTHSPPFGKEEKATTPVGVIFAFTGVIASSLYTVWIGTYHRKLNMNSMELLFNQAPVSSFLLLLFIPLVDKVSELGDVSINRWLMVGISGVFASLINLSQFSIIVGAGAVSSTVVGHAKTCSIVIIGWIGSGRGASDKSLLGVLMAVGGMILYSIAVSKTRR